jgi:hypothetical protein
VIELLKMFTATDYAAWVRESLYGWAIMLTFHAFGNAIVVGTMLIVAARVWGLFWQIPYATLNRFMIPLVWVGVVTQVISGLSLFSTKAERYGVDPMFLSKMAFLVLGITITIWLQRLIRREALAWGTAGHATSRGLQVASAAGLAWCGVLIMGRLTAYLSQLYHPA